MKLPRDLADRIFTILVDTCGANPRGRDLFVDAHVRGVDCEEYRFQGAIGFGGKFRTDHHGHPQHLYVTCYPEEETPKTLKMIELANAALLELWKSYGHSTGKEEPHT